MKCEIKDCERSTDCGFLEIIGVKKMPIKADKCSWFKKVKETKNKSSTDQSTELGAPPVVKKETKRKAVKRSASVSKDSSTCEVSKKSA